MIRRKEKILKSAEQFVEEVKIRRLAHLCVEYEKREANGLLEEVTDEQLKQIQAYGEELYLYLLRLGSFARYRAGEILCYRRRKGELQELSNEELSALLGKQLEAKRANLENTADHEMPDSAFTSPPIDSDEYIIGELLKERQ